MSKHSIKVPASQVGQKQDISKSRKDELIKCLELARSNQDDIKKVDVHKIKAGKYPFKGMKLSRTDVEFLLSEQSEGPGFSDWNNTIQGGRIGLDLRGANLRGVDLSGLQLAGVVAGLTEEEWFIATPHQCQMAISYFDDANFTGALLKGATFCYAHLTGANFSRAHLQEADFFGANLRRASFYKTDLNNTNLYGATLEGAKVSKVELQNAKVDQKVLNEVVIDRTVVPPWSVEEKRIPVLPRGFYREYKSPRWLTHIFEVALIPILIGLISVVVTGLVAGALDNISQKRQAEQAFNALQLQAKQKELELKNGLIVSISGTVANALAEIELIQYDEENNDLNIALRNYTDGYRNLLVSGSQIEAQLASYFSQGQSGGQPCANMSNYISKGFESYNNVVLAWDNYYRVVLANFYDLESTTDGIRRADDIKWIEDVFIKYDIPGYWFVVDQTPVDWSTISQYSFIQKYNNSPYLVKVGNGSSEDNSWINLEQIIDGYKSIIGKCVLSLNIPALTVA